MLKTILTSILTSTLLSASIYAEVTRAPYIQLATESSQVIVWRTNSEIKPIVRIGKSVDKLETLVPADDILIRRVDKKYVPGKSLWESADVKKRNRQAPEDRIQFEATVKGLEPGTLYYYAIYDGDQRITPSDASYHFQTHPKVGEKVDTRFWIVGDSGTGGKDQARVAQGMRKYLGNQKLDGYLHVGDMAYGSGTDKEFSKNFFAMYEPILRNTVCWASMGNHEGYTADGSKSLGPYYDAYVLPKKAEAGGVASGSEAYYSFDYGNVHFICLNSHDLDRSPTAAMAQWLKADLEKTKADFLVAFFHHPPYTKGSHDSDKEKQLIEMREMIMPILESGGVDVVYTGHSHIYERSMLIDGAYVTPSTNEGVVLDDGDGDPAGDGSYKKSEGLAPNNGTVQIVAGHGGTRLRKKSNHVLMSKVILMHGSVMMETSGNKMTMKMIDADGKQQDLCVIEKGGKVARNIVKNPRAPKFMGEEKPISHKSAKMPKHHQPVFAPHTEWSYLAGRGLHPAKGWTKIAFDTSNWKKGKAGFGYSDKDDNTVLDMKDKYTVVYTRKEFQIDDLDEAKNEKLGLAIKYDDGFIAYINGVEVVRSGVDFGRGVTAKGFHNHEARAYEFFTLNKHMYLLKKGKNVISIEGHNADIGSSDFSLDAFLTFKTEKK